ncbi:MAG: FMN-binding negative transcriptional regulator [Proteobacteria bacterium]|jgi:transcriptional regulator|nr:FMN-binding negative transcriptional regulator [Pseudomonadota bacterium]
MSLYVPEAFATGDRAVLERLVREYPFATVVTPAAQEPAISHLPLLLADGDGNEATLIGHMARANAHWQVAAGVESIAIFHGPHAYVSPSWYENPAQAVPTWSYATAHVHGVLEPVADAGEAAAILDLLVARFEEARPEPWRFAMPEPGRSALVGAIVAFRMRVRRVEVKLKLSQNRPVADRMRVADALGREGHCGSDAVAAWMRDYSGIAPKR